MQMDDPYERTCYVSSLPDKVTEELLKELFVQVGPLETLILRTSGGANSGSSHRYALAVFKHELSVPFACDMLDRIKVFGRRISVRPKQDTRQSLLYHANTSTTAQNSHDSAPFLTVPRYRAVRGLYNVYKRREDEKRRIYARRIRDYEHGYTSRHNRTYENHYSLANIRRMQLPEICRFASAEDFESDKPCEFPCAPNTSKYFVHRAPIEKMTSQVTRFGMTKEDRTFYSRELTYQPAFTGRLVAPNFCKNNVPGQQSCRWMPYHHRAMNLLTNMHWRTKQRNLPFIGSRRYNRDPC